MQNAVRARIDGNQRAIAPGDHSVFVNDEQSALAEAVCSAVGAVLAGNGSLGLKIGEQREMQMTSLRKCVMTPGTIHGHSQQFGPKLLKLGEDLVVKSHL